MKTLLLVGAFLAMVGVSGSQARTEANTDDRDPINVATVRGWLESPDFNAVLGFGSIEKHLWRMGDSIAVAIMHGYSDAELLEPVRLRKVLSIIKVAFSHTTKIGVQEYRDPRITLLMLANLRGKVSDASLKMEIAKLEAYLGEGRD